MKICFISTFSPWFFGPYGKQLSLLCNYFIIFMDIGNYDIQNRKSIDTALFAFEEYLIDNDEILFDCYDIYTILNFEGCKK